ncbi:glycosyl hydrolase family 28 protein [Acutalibacter sp.]|uniref:glycosyl hydrolase family 28 protein n=1 Tax=Acutalibacter sp. TaxID=1918636 RepID=UPI0021737FBA|nr:hypothetical protein [Acutalibacter sp.]
MAVRYNPNPVRTQEPLCQVNTWDEVETSSLYTVECNGQAQTVYHTDSFDYVIPVVRDDSPLQVTVQVHKPFEEAVVRPAKAGILPKREGERLSLSLPRPQKLTLELDGDLKTPLYILCTHWAPKPEKVDHLFESGKIYNVGVLHVKAGETVYLEEGCMVFGCIDAFIADGIRILGNGVLNGCVWHPKEENGGKPMIRMVLCNHIQIQGITVVDGGQWHVLPGACQNVEIDDINIMSRVCTGDGIDIVGCEHVALRHSFIRASDDCVCIKAASHPDPAANRDVRDIRVEHCVLWNAEPGNAVEIGYEVRCDEVCDILFKDIDIVHCEYEGNQSGGVLTIHNADRPYIHDIVYEDIRIEDAQEKFIDIKVLDSKYSLDRKRGRVEKIYFKNIEILNGAFPVSIIRGFEMANEMSRPQDFYFDHVVILGQEMRSPNEMRMVVELAHNLHFGEQIYSARNPF